MEQLNSDGSILDLDVDDVDESDTESNNAATLNQHLEGGRGGGGGVIRGGGVGGVVRGGGGGVGRGIEITERPTTRLITEKPPKTAGSSIQVFSNVTLSGRGKEILNEAELGVNRIVAVRPTILQNQYWMLPGAVFDD